MTFAVGQPKAEAICAAGKPDRKYITKGLKVNFRGIFRFPFSVLIFCLQVSMVMGMVTRLGTHGCSIAADDHLYTGDNQFDHDKHCGSRIGEAPNPGPTTHPPTVSRSTITIEIGNVTHLNSARHVITNRSFDYFFGQEHSLPKTDWSRVRQAYRPGSLHLSDLDPEAEAPLGGLCALRLDRRQNITPKAKSHKFSDINGKGRVQLYALDLSAEVYVLIYNIYGWTNAAKDKAAASRTNNMIEMILDDIGHQPPGPVLIVGDLNGDPPNFKALHEALQEGDLIDVGAQAGQWGRPPHEYTCKAPGAKKPSRRDFVFANSDAFNLIVDFNVDHQANLAVHDMLQMKLAIPNITKKVRTVIKPKPLNDILVDLLWRRHGEENKQAKDAQKDKKEGLKDSKRPWSNASAEPTDPFDRLKAKPTKGETPDECNHTAPQESAHITRGDCTYEQIQALKTDLAIIMDDYLTKQEINLQRALDEDHLTHFLQIWTECFEISIFHCAGIQDTDRLRYQGRSEAKIKFKEVPRSGKYDHTQGRMKLSTRDNELERMSRQHRRLQAIRDTSRLLGAANDDPQAQPSTWTQAATTEVKNNIKQFIIHANKANKVEEQAVNFLVTGNYNWRKMYFTLTKLTKDLQNKVEDMEAAITKRIRLQRAQRFQGKGAQKAISQYIRNVSVKPLQAIQRQTQQPDKPIGTYTSDPEEVDEIIRSAWEPIYNGNVTDMQDLVHNFTRKYDKHIYKGDEQNIAPFCWQDLKRECTSQTDTAGGLDGWTKNDLYWTSDLGFRWLAQWYQALERTQAWPEAITKARAVFLSKDPDDLGNPMAYRILKITSMLYRIWASVRIQNLEQWVKSWADPAMFAGVPGAGAEEAWYLTQLDFEIKRLTGSHITAGSIDVFKCFDQIVRPLVIYLARQAGMPRQVLDTYEAFQSDLTVYNQIGEYLGEPHRHKCSIPQGCPFSMAFVALLMRPWIMYMREHNVEPRVLADDLFLYATRTKHASKAVQGMQLSRQYFADIGAKIADKKCFMASTCPSTRSRLRTLQWDGQGTRIAVVTHFRDLGTHVAMDLTGNATTITSRLRKATVMTRRLKWLPIPKEEKAKAIRTTILPGALYGTEPVKCNAQELQALRSAIVDAIGPRSTRRCMAMVFEACSAGGDLDPMVQQLVRKVMLMKRIMAKYPQTKIKVKSAICAYTIAENQGTMWARANRSIDTKPALGPVGHLLVQLGGAGAALDDNYTIHMANEVGIAINATPWQEIKTQIEALSKRARLRLASEHRAYLGKVTEIDTQTLHAAMTKCDRDDKHILQHIITGATWTAQQLHDIGRATTNLCRLCGQPELDIRHGLWHCQPVVAKAKELQKDTQQSVSVGTAVSRQPTLLAATEWIQRCPTPPQVDIGILPDDLPRCLQVGIPPSMTAKHCTTFWGSSCHTLSTDRADMRKLLGVPGRTRTQQAIAEGKDIVTEELCVDRDIQQADRMNARQLFQHLKGEHVISKLIPPVPCEQAAPREINVYTDGSLHDPDCSQFSLGGAGVWWPHRQADPSAEAQQCDHPTYVESIAEAEADIAEIDQQQQGLMLTTFLQGFGGSSTRMELAAAIMAIASRLPAHVGTDSQAFMTKALNVHNLIRTNRAPRRPWETQHDGDLWSVYHKHAKIKGVHAINISKVKGHATQQMVDNKTVRECDKKGNDMADKAAEQGVNLLGLPLVQLGARYAKRQKEYIKLTQLVHQHLIHMYRIREALMDESMKEERSRAADQLGDQHRLHDPLAVPEPKRRKFQTQVQAAVPPASLQPGASDRDRRLTFRLSVQQCGDLCKRHPWVDQLQSFLGRLVYRKVDDGMCGCTWLELFIIYRLAGYNMETSPSQPSANAKPTLGNQLKTFRLAVRRMASRMLQDEDKVLFKGGVRPAPRLQSCGIGTLLAVLPLQLRLQSGLADQLAVQVLMSQRRIAVKDAQKILQDHRLIPIRPLQTRGRVKWQMSLRQWGKGSIFVGEPVEAQKSVSVGTAVSRQPTLLDATEWIQRRPTPPQDPSGLGVPTSTSTAASASSASSSTTPWTPTPNRPRCRTASQMGCATDCRPAKRPKVVYLKCPRCPTAVDGTRTAFSHTNLDGRTWCSSCRSSLPVHSWRCMCGSPWFACDWHKDEPQRIRNANAHLPRRRSRYRAIPRMFDAQGPDANHDLDDWLDNPPVPKRARKSDVDMIDLEGKVVDAINPNFLSASLRQRFAHLCGGSITAMRR